MKIVVTGGRRYEDAERVWKTLSLLAPSAIAHGGQTGADRHATDWARRHSIPCRAYEPDWNLGKSAGPRRNTTMLRDFKPDFVLAFPGGPGTADCVAQAIGFSVPFITVPSRAREQFSML